MSTDNIMFSWRYKKNINTFGQKKTTLTTTKNILSRAMMHFTNKCKCV